MELSVKCTNLYWVWGAIVTCDSVICSMIIKDCVYFFSELFCWGKAMVAYKMSQQRKKEESERLRGER